jgi:SAM-dependent methyltransferase
MDHREVGRLWDSNADAWTRLARQGCDIYRDWLNTPAFFAMLPEVRDLRGLDIGCGEGHNTRLLAERGARMTAIDISARFAALARQMEARQPRGIRYTVASAVALPFADACFDFATGFMSFMDIPEHERVVSEAFRVLKPGGFLQFSILHPCFMTPRWRWIHDEQGRRVAVECGDYFHQPQGLMEQWIFGAARPRQLQGLEPFRIPRFFRTLSSWVNLLVDTGFRLERLHEPTADDQALERHPKLYDTRAVAYFLHVLCRKG